MILNCGVQLVEDHMGGSSFFFCVCVCNTHCKLARVEVLTASSKSHLVPEVHVQRWR